MLPYLLLIVGIVLGSVVAVLFCSRRIAELRLVAERIGAELTMQQQMVGSLQGELNRSRADYQAALGEIAASRADVSGLQAELRSEKAQRAVDKQNRDALQADYQTAQRELGNVREALARAGTALEKEQQQRLVEADRIKKMQDAHYDRFRNLAGEIMESNAGKLKQANKESMDSLLSPLRVQLESLGKAVTATNETAAGNKASLEAAIKAMMEKTESLSHEAESLTLALRGNSKKQGDWGEMILERMLEESGLRKGEEYYVQENHKTDEGCDVRPDVVIRFPDKRCVVVDSKVSLSAYVQYTASDSDTERSQHLMAHVTSVRKHIDELSAKDYSATVEGSISYVLMFMPNEASYMAAVQAAPSLPLDAYRKKIVLISPTNLLMALQLAYNLWQKERQTRNVENIIDRATKLYDKLALVQESLERVGKGIETAQSAYSQAFSQLFTGRGNYARQLENLREMGISPNKRLRLGDDEEQ